MYRAGKAFRCRSWTPEGDNKALGDRPRRARLLLLLAVFSDFGDAFVSYEPIFCVIIEK
jgi:hypothetical protein